MEEATRYWCHMCSQTVNPILEIDSVKCPICQSGFVEEMESSPASDNTSLNFEFGGSDSDRALSLWAPILLGMMGNQQRRIRRMGLEEGENDHVRDHDRDHVRDHDRDHDHDGEGELDAIMRMRRRRRRSSAAILQLLQGMRAGIVSEAEGGAGAGPRGNSDSETETDQRMRRSTDRDNNRDRDRVILINPFNQTIIVQGSYDNDSSISRAPIGSLGDYFIGPGLDLLLQHLSENDPNRYGTPPAQKEAVEALATVKIEEALQCSVCLDDCEIGDQVKEMPCKHKFHSKCILPWLELHSSCPICRHQLPCDDSKLASHTNNDAIAIAGDATNERGSRQFSVPLPWPFSTLFSPSNTGPSSSSTSHQDDDHQT